MRNEQLINLRKKRKLSQVKLAEKLYVPVETICKWERMNSVPSIEDMRKLAEVLLVEEDVIVSIFKPENTRVAEENKKEAEMYNLLLKLFWDCNNIELFIPFTHLFTLGQTSGVACCNEYVFPFTKVIADMQGDAIILADFSDNYIVFTDMNVIEVEPVSVNYDVYTFDIVINCPMFPIDLKYSRNSFRQRIRVSFYNR